MHRMILLSLQVKFTVMANRLIHFLRRIPLLKRLISSGIYGSYGLKTVFAIIGGLIMINKKILFRAIYVVIIVLTGVALCQILACGGYSQFFEVLSADQPRFMDMTARNVVFCCFSVWVAWSFLGGVINARIASAKNTAVDDMMINHLNASPAVYAKSFILLDRAVDAALYLPFLLLAFVLSGLPIWGALVALALFTAVRLWCEAASMLTFRVVGKTFTGMPFSLIVIPVIFVVPIMPMLNVIPDWGAIFCSPITAAAAIAAGGLAWLYIVRYTEYALLIKNEITRASETLAKASRQAQQSVLLQKRSKKSWTADTNENGTQPEKHTDKKGFSYLNAIFFDRHKSFFRKGLLLRLLPILAVGLVVSAVSVFVRLKTGAPLWHDIAAMFFDRVPIFFFILYIISMGRTVTALVFSSCDINMLHYPYYRTRATILASFRARLVYILRYNLLITSFLAVAVISAVSCIGWSFDPLRAMMLAVLFTVIGVFFAFNDLFLYYVIQPYNSGGESKSIPYALINGAVYLFSYFNMNLSLDFFAYFIFIIVITMLYLGVGAILLPLRAPKRFKLR